MRGVNANTEIEGAKLYMASGTYTGPHLAVSYKEDGQVQLCAGGFTPDTPCGILLEKEVQTEREQYAVDDGLMTVEGSWKKNERCAFARRGRTLCLVGTAGATDGNLAMVEASTGRLVDHEAGGNVVGRFLADGTEGQTIAIDVDPVITGAVGTHVTP